MSQIGVNCTDNCRLNYCSIISPVGRSAGSWSFSGSKNVIADLLGQNFLWSDWDVDRNCGVGVAPLGNRNYAVGKNWRNAESYYYGLNGYCKCPVLDYLDTASWCYYSLSLRSPLRL